MSKYLCTIIPALVLAACSGGGGDGTTLPPTPTPVTVTCPNGTSQTAATTELANTACPVPLMVSISPTDGSTTTSPDSFTEVAVLTDSTLDPGSLTSANVTLKIGTTTTIAGAVSATAPKGFKFVPAAKLAYGQAYNFSATVKDTLGKTLAVASTFTTAPMNCTAPDVWDGTSCTLPHAACIAPQVWTPGLNACVYPMGVRVADEENYVDGCINWRDQCWRDAVASGAVKWIATSAVATGYNNRPLVFAYYRYIYSQSVIGPPLYTRLVQVLYSDTGEPFSGDISNGQYSLYEFLFGQLESDWVYGTATGLVQHFTRSTDRCLELSWDPAPINAWSSHPAACPVQ